MRTTVETHNNKSRSNKILMTTKEFPVPGEHPLDSMHIVFFLQRNVAKLQSSDYEN